MDKEKIEGEVIRIGYFTLGFILGCVALKIAY